jgi:Domain of unknown function (DUF4190)
MSIDHDNEFQAPIEKMQTRYDTFEPPSSKLAVTSLVSGILGVTVFPLYGSIVAVATGHAALGEIRESEGRLGGKSLAKVGLGLGYFAIILALIAAAILTFVFYFASSRSVDVATPSFFESGEYKSGVKMVNQMDREDFKLIEGTEVGVNESDIIAYYNAGKPKSNPEFALLTTQKLIYLNDGRKTVFDLKDLAYVLDDKTFQQTYNVHQLPNGGVINNFQYDIYHIEVRTKQATRMRIDVKPTEEGAMFFDALMSALRAAGMTITPGAPAP